MKNLSDWAASLTQISLKPILRIKKIKKIELKIKNKVNNSSWDVLANSLLSPYILSNILKIHYMVKNSKFSNIPENPLGCS